MTTSKVSGQIRFLLLALTLAVSACLSANQTSQNQSLEPSGELSFSAPDSKVDLAKPLEVSREPEDVALCAQVNQTIEQSEFANARWGIIVVSLKNGRVVCEREGRKLFNPASVQKILTSVVALDALGADFRWQTKIYSTREIDNGVLNGDLILYGHGAPDFNDEALENLVNQLRGKNLMEIKGDIIGDASFFKGDNLGDGWTWNDVQWYYGSEASALTINQNQATITLADGKPHSSTEYVQISGTIQPVEDIEAVGLKRGLGDNQIYVWGNANALNARVAVNNPALLAAQSLKRALEKKGIKVKGESKSADWKSENKSDVSAAFELASIESRNLGEIIEKMNKDSINLYAELILRTLGKKIGDAAPDENQHKQKLRGDDAAGANVIKKWLTEKNVATGEIKIHDGSGLSRLDLVTPESIGRALIYASQSKINNAFKKSLPVAGIDGTLRGRLGNARGKISGKTGSITYVNSLAGYARKSADETFAFVIFCNNQTQKNDSTGVIDAIASSLAEK